MNNHEHDPFNCGEPAPYYPPEEIDRYENHNPSAFESGNSRYDEVFYSANTSEPYSSNEHNESRSYDDVGMAALVFVTAITLISFIAVLSGF